MRARSQIAVSYIIPTMAAPDRAEGLERAIASIADQAGVRAVPIVVVNGPNPAPTVLARLERDPRIRLERLARADLPAAIRWGRTVVKTPYFGALDDDDFLLPGALQMRADCLESGPDVDCVVTNGYQRHAGGDTAFWTDPGAIRANPLKALLERNWLLPGSWLRRTSGSDLAIFDHMPRYLECTYLAVQFALQRRIRFLESPTVVRDESRGLSASVGYHLGQPAALEAILRLPLPADYRRGLTRQLAMAYHTVADFHRERGDLEAAWTAHTASLRLPSGGRFVVSTRHFVAPTIRRWLNVGVEPNSPYNIPPFAGGS